jgi:hypothetical protein
VEAQATRRILLENRKLVTKREDLRLQGRTGSKTRGHQGKKGDEKRAHRGSHHDLTSDRNLFVFRSDGIFGSHRTEADRLRHSKFVGLREDNNPKSVVKENRGEA